MNRVEAVSKAVACLALAWMAMPHAQATAVTVEVRSAANALVRDAAVVLDPAQATPPATHASAIIDQINKRFEPRLLIVRTGTAVAFPNSDHIRHQVYSFSPAKPFNLKLYAGSPESSVVFDKPGLVVLGCNIHDSMLGYIAVVDTPWFGKSGADGRVTLDVPAGHYRLRIWHAEMSSVWTPRPVEVQREPAFLTASIPLDPTADPAAVWTDRKP